MNRPPDSGDAAAAWPAHRGRRPSRPAQEATMTENPARTSMPSDVPSGVPHSMSRLVDHWGLVLTYGLITIGLGLVLVLWPDETLKVLAVLIGIQFILTGIFRLVLAVASRSLDGGSRAIT